MPLPYSELKHIRSDFGFKPTLTPPGPVDQWLLIEILNAAQRGQAQPVDDNLNPGKALTLHHMVVKIPG